MSIKDEKDLMAFLSDTKVRFTDEHDHDHDHSDHEDGHSSSDEDKCDDCLGKLLTLVLAGDAYGVRKYVKSKEYMHARAEPGAEQEIMLSIRTAIQRADVPVLKALNEVFNLDNPNDVRTVRLAAQSPMGVWKVFADKEKALGQKFKNEDQPIVAAFSAGNFEVAKWLKDWADSNNVPRAVKIMALRAAAANGHTGCCNLFSVSEQYLTDVVRTLIYNGHSSKVADVVYKRAPDGAFANDLSFNNFEMLDVCAGHFDALSAMIRHPSVQEHMEALPKYYHAVDRVVRDMYETDVRVILVEHQKDVAKRAHELHKQGIIVKTACSVAKMETAEYLKKKLCDKKLMTYTHK